MKVFKKALAATAAVLIGVTNICSTDTQPLIGDIDTVCAETYSEVMTYGDLYYKQVDEDEDGTYDYIEITNCDESVETVDIPSEIDGLPVTSIWDSTFVNCKNLAIIKIPNSVTSIGFCAFSGCKSLTSIEIPNSVTSIGFCAFSECKSLTSIEIPDSVTSIGFCAFSGCKSLTSVKIGNSVTSIGDDAFEYCKSLTSIDVSENNSSYSSNDGVLFNKNKTELICFPIGSEITEYIIPDSVTSIGERAFLGCSSLTSIEISDSVTSIGESAFQRCSSLISIEIPNSVTIIETFAFSECSSLTSITIENPECEINDSKSTISDGYDNDYYYYNGVIRGHENSTAKAYAEKYYRKFESLDAKPTEPVSGDIDGDGKATLYDAIIVCKCMISAKDVTEEQKKNADVNGDGRIDLYDAIYVAECMIGKHK